MEKSILFFTLFLLPFWGYTQEPLMMEVSPEESPLDGVVKRTIRSEKRILEYPNLRENDLLWEKRIWRLIDTRERMNLVFRYPEKYFFDILTEGIASGAITAYSPETDDFQYTLSQQDVMGELLTQDTVPVWIPDSMEEELQVIENEMDPARIIRYRIKEVWYFDKVHSTLKVRILGIAPMITEVDAMGNFKYERPLFWVYYPDCRDWLARHTFYAEGNDHRLMSWEDLFEMRRFSSYVTKESNVHDERLEAYLSGTDRLLSSERIEQDIFNFEGYLWSN